VIFAVRSGQPAPIALEQEQNLSGTYKLTLQKMIEAMNNSATPLPTFPR